MKIDLVGPARRGLALGLNESSGYVGVAVTAFATGALAASYAPRTVVWAGAAVLAVAGTLVSVLLVRETRGHPSWSRPRSLPRLGRTGSRSGLRRASSTTSTTPSSGASCRSTWPRRGAFVTEIGAVAALYPAVWGIGQLGAGWLSDRAGRRPLIVAGMLVQAVALALFLGPSSYAAAALLGVGTALVYPTLIAVVSDSVTPRARARAVGAYRFWRHAGRLAGAAVAGAVADLAGSGAAIMLVAALTAASGLVVVAATRPLTAAQEFSQMP